MRTLRGHDHTISAVRFVPPPLGAWYLDKEGEKKGGGGAEAAAGGSGGGVDLFETGANFIVTASRDATVKFWDLETGFCDHTIADHGDWVRCIAVRPAGASRSDGGRENGERASQSLSPELASSASLALVATSGNDRTIYVYEAHDKRAKVAELRGHDHVVESLSFLCSSLMPKTGVSATSSTGGAGVGRPTAAASSTWDYLASGGRDRTVRLWNVAGGGSCLMVFRAHENWVRGVLLHPSGNHILSCGDDRSIRVFDIKVRTNNVLLMRF